MINIDLIKYTWITLMMMHVLGDFYFQSEKMAKNKKEHISGVIVHSVVYALTTAAGIFFLMPGVPIPFIIVIGLSHAVIDLVKFYVCHCEHMQKMKFSLDNTHIFLMDQVIHILVLILVTYWLSDYTVEELYNGWLREFFTTMNLQEKQILNWSIKLMLIHKPANILISNILEKYKPDSDNTNKEDQENKIDRESKNGEEKQQKNAGRFIGTLERIIMTILMTIGQYSAVGLVLTAKSIARYDKISNDKEFAEYYLLGTLLSTICAICVSVVF